MREEEAVFYRDVREKTITGRSARHMRTHCGRRGPVRLPSDTLTKRQRERLNGQCRVYRLGQSMDWDAFLQMPRELRITYLKRLRRSRSPGEIGDLMGVSEEALALELEALELE